MADCIPCNELPPEQASNVNNGAHLPGLAPTQVFNYYSEWARQGSYEKHLGPENYRGPVICAEAIARHCSDKEAEIVDVAAGTGLLGKELHEMGYSVLDALEPAEGMLEVARGLGIFRNCILEPFDDNVHAVPNDSYDVVGIAGGMGEGHIPCSALPEMARIVRPGGVVVIVMREAYLQEVADYKDRLEPKMAELVKAGTWEQIERTVVPRYSFTNNGVIYVFRIT